MIVDAHMHIEHEDPDVIYAMEKEAGVDKAVIWSIWNPSRESNDLTLRAFKRHPDFFIPFGHIRPSDPYWKDEIRRIAEDLEWKGLKLHFGEFANNKIQTISDLHDSHVQGFRRERLDEILEAAQDYGLITVIDCGGRYDVMGGLVKDFTKAPIIIPHLGSNIQYLKAFCELTQLGHVYLDTSFIHVYRVIISAVRLCGSDKLIWGSDGYWMHPVVELAKLKVLKLPKEDEEKVLGGNIMRLLSE